MKKLFLFLNVLFVALCVEAQHGMPKQHLSLDSNLGIRIPGTKEGYYITNDHQIVRGIWLLDSSDEEKSKVLVIPEQPRHEAKIFYPGEIVGYGYVNGERYNSAQMEIDKMTRGVFLEQILEDENISLYFYGGLKKLNYYFMQKADGPILPIKDGGEEFRNYLRSQAEDCAAFAYLETYPLKLERYELVRLYHAYIDCNTNLYQKVRWGVRARLGMNHLNEGLDRDFDIGLSCVAGLFVQIPIDGSFSFTPEVNLLWTANKGRALYDKMVFESCDYDQLAVEVPLIFRYTYNRSTKRFVPYGELGPSIMLSLKKDRVDHPRASVIEDRFGLNRFLYGAAFGAGVEYKMNSLHSLTMGLRCSFSNGVKKQRKEQLLSLGVVVGVNF